MQRPSQGLDLVHLCPLVKGETDLLEYWSLHWLLQP